MGFGPAALDRAVTCDAGRGQDDLLLGQICNLPYRAQFRDRVMRPGCADYGLTDTPAGAYHSVFVVRAADAPHGLAHAAQGWFAYNGALSHSRWGGPLAAITAQGLHFHATLRTGAHVDSLHAVAQGRADLALACIDAVTWRMLKAWELVANTLRIIGRCPVSPGQTFITHRCNDPAPIRAALVHAIAHLPRHHAQRPKARCNRWQFTP